MKQLFESITFTTKSANLLANQILEFSKNEQKKLTVNSVSFNVKEELSEVFQGLKSLVEENKNQLAINLEVPNDLIVQSDIVKIYQIFYNLIGNANKFTEKGTIKVEVKSDIVSQNIAMLQVTVSDTGKGIHKEDIANIFTNFYQSVAEEKVHNLGAGLGLYLCKELIELLGGTIQIESELGKGTQVLFTLKLSK
jgi:two-component system sensor histidine kinase BarA